MTDGPTQEMPNTIKRFEQLWYGVVFLSTINILISLNQTPAGSTNGLPFEELIGVAVFVLILCLVVWLVTSVSRRRKHWAKWILIVLVCSGIAGHLKNPSFAFQDGQLAGILTWVSALLQLIAISLLFTPVATQWLSSKAVPATPLIGAVSTTPETDLPSSDAICSQCHKALPSTAKFCSECGSAATTRHAALKVLRLVAAFTILGAIGAVLYWNGGLSLFQPNLGLEVTSRGGEFVSVIDITNVKQSPIVINEVIVNGSSNDQCIAKPKRSLAEGNNLTMPAHKFFCGNLVRVTIRTDRGDRDYLFSQR